LAQFLSSEEKELTLTLQKTKESFKTSKEKYGADFKTKITNIVDNFNNDFADRILGQYTNIFKNKNLSNEAKQNLITNLDQLYDNIG